MVGFAKDLIVVNMLEPVAFPTHFNNKLAKILHRHQHNESSQVRIRNQHRAEQKIRVVSVEAGLCINDNRHGNPVVSGNITKIEATGHQLRNRISKLAPSGYG